MIEEVSIANFKAFAEKQNIPIKPITLIFGENSAGKSSILKAIRWTKQAYLDGSLGFERAEAAQEESILGDFDSVLFAGKGDSDFPAVDKGPGGEKRGRFTIGMKIESDVDEVCMAQWEIGKLTERQLEALVVGSVEESFEEVISALLDLRRLGSMGEAATLDWSVDRLFGTVELWSDSEQRLKIAERLSKISKILERRKESPTKEKSVGSLSSSEESITEEFQRIWKTFRKEYLKLGKDEKKRLKEVIAGIQAMVDTTQNPHLIRWEMRSKEPGFSLFGRPQRCREALVDFVNYGEELDEQDAQFISESVLNKSLHFVHDPGEEERAVLKKEKHRWVFKKRLAKKLLKKNPTFRPYYVIAGLKPKSHIGSMDVDADLEDPELNTAQELVARGAVQFCDNQINDLERELRRIRYLGPLRSMPPRYLMTSFAEGGEDQGEAAWRTIRDNDFVRKEVNRWLGESRLDLGYEFEVNRFVDESSLRRMEKRSRRAGQFTINPSRKDFREGFAMEEDQSESTPSDPVENLIEGFFDKNDRHCFRELLLRDLQVDATVRFQDVGIGVSQVIPIIVAALGAKSEVILVEQPELHLHPALQARMGDLFIQSALAVDEKGEESFYRNRFVLETHSEHLILRILRRIRETTAGELPEGVPPITPDDVAVLYVQRTENGSEVVELPVTEDGDFSKPWPKGFFTERVEELF